MNTSIIIAVLSLGCAGALTAMAQPTRPGTVEIYVDDLIGPFGPTPESRAAARKEALAGYAWFSRMCRESKHGEKALAQCMSQARRDRDSQLAYADGGHRN